MIQSILRINKWVIGVSLLLLVQSVFELTALRASENTVAIGKGLAVATVTKPPTVINLPDWPTIEIDTSSLDPNSSENQIIPLLFSFGGMPDSLFTLSIPASQASTESIVELINTSASVGFFDDTGLQSFQLQLQLSGASLTPVVDNQDAVEITVEHN